MSKATKIPEQPAVKQKVDLDPRFICKLTATLLAICATVALLLGCVNSLTEPVIRKMQEEKTAAAMAQVLAADEYVKQEGQWENVTAMYCAMAGDKQMGYVVEVTTNGFGGAINLVVGVDMNGTVTGVSVTKDSETANLGSKVTRSQSVLDRFVGLAGPVSVNSGENRFDGVTGATVSSKAVAAGVNAALAAVAANKG